MTDHKLALLQSIVEQREDALSYLQTFDAPRTIRTASNRLEQARKALWDHQDALVTGPDDAINSWMS